MWTMLNCQIFFAVFGFIFNLIYIRASKDEITKDLKVVVIICAIIWGLFIFLKAFYWYFYPRIDHLPWEIINDGDLFVVYCASILAQFAGIFLSTSILMLSGIWIFKVGSGR